MQGIANHLKDHGRLQLDQALHLCSLGLGCCERLTEAGVQTTRALLTQMEAERDSLLRGDSLGSMASAMRMTLDHWGAMVSQSLQFQRDVWARQGTDSA